MTPELQKYYEDRFEMMAMNGWLELTEDAKNIFNAVNNLAPVQNEADLFYRKGQLDILQWLLSLKESSANAYDQLSSGDVSDGS